MDGICLLHFIWILPLSLLTIGFIFFSSLDVLLKYLRIKE